VRAGLSGISQEFLGPSSGADSYPEEMGNRSRTLLEHRPRTAFLVVAVLFALLLDVVVATPAIVSFALATSAAVAWCLFLDSAPLP